MTEQQEIFTADDAREIGESIGIDWAASPFDVEQFRAGLHVELEHGRRDPETNVTDDDRAITGKIARAHLNEFPDYYTRLAKMEAEAEDYWSSRQPRSSGDRPGGPYRAASQTAVAHPYDQDLGTPR